MKLSVCGFLTVFALVASPMASGAAAAQSAAEKGAAVFSAQKCSMCHGMDGKGNQKGALDDIGSKLKGAEIRSWILTPAEMAAKAKAERKPAMKPYANLAKADLDALVEFLESKKKK